MISTVAAILCSRDKLHSIIQVLSHLNCNMFPSSYLLPVTLLLCILLPTAYCFSPTSASASTCRLRVKICPHHSCDKLTNNAALAACTYCRERIGRHYSKMMETEGLMVVGRGTEQHTEAVPPTIAAFSTC